MKPAVKWLLIGTLLLLTACQGAATDLFYGRPREPYFSDTTVTPVAPNLVRIYFFREWEPYESLSRPWIRLNGQAIGIADPGGVYFRDVPPGEYHITVDSVGIYSDQFKTVVLRPGETLYVRIESRNDWFSGAIHPRDTLRVTLVVPSVARAEMRSLRVVSGNP